jgi:hypothetical protein
VKIKWTGTEVAIVIVLVWIVFFGGMGTLRDLLTPTIPTPTPPVSATLSTPDIKAVMNYTPTPGAGGGSQLSTVQAKLLPTPRTVITIGDAKGFSAAMYPKLTTLPVTLRIFTERSAPGSAVFCAKLGNSAVSFCSYAVVWAEWQAGLTEVAFQGAKIEVTPGKQAAPVLEGEAYVVRKAARIVVTIERWGLNGPIIRDSNMALYTVQDYPAWVRTVMFTQDNYLEETRQVANNAALYLARWDSLIGVWRTGGKVDYSGIESLRATMEANLNADTLPYLNAYQGKDLSGYQTPKQQLLSIAQAQVRAAGFDSVESLTIRIAPLVPGQVVYVTTMDDKAPAQLNFDAAVKRYGESSEKWTLTQAELAAGTTK